MKKFIFAILAIFTMAISAYAQNDYIGSKFTDNWRVTLKGGAITPLNDMFNKSYTDPIVVLGTDKFVNPWLGFGADARTAIGTGKIANSHTAFDAVNVNAYGKLNIVNLFAYNGTRRLFEPVIYTGLGWAHNTAGNYRLNRGNGELNHVGHNNYLTYRAGVEFNFNLGKSRNWTIVVDPSVVWRNIDNGKLAKKNGNFELTAGIAYNFGPGWRKHTCKPVVTTITEYITKEITNIKTVPELIQNTYIVTFAQNSAELSEDAVRILKSITGSVIVEAYASPEGNAEYNLELSQRRADAVKNFLTDNGAKVISAEGKGVIGEASNRIAIITIQR